MGVNRSTVYRAYQDLLHFKLIRVMGRDTLPALEMVNKFARECDSKSREYYPQTLFTAEQAHAGPCTAKTTIYCANIAAGFMLAQFTKYLRLLPVDPDIQVNLLASEINVGEC